MKRTAVVTYNYVSGIPVGRYEKGQAVLYSGYGASFLEDDGLSRSNDRRNDAERRLDSIRQDLLADIATIDEVFVYVGNAAVETGMELIRDILKKGKKVTMIACDCGYKDKLQFAQEQAVPFILSECGGRETCFRQFTAHI